MKRRIPKSWRVALILLLLAVDYATILRVELFNEMAGGKTFLEAVLHGNPYLTALGIAISVIGCAWLIMLIIQPRAERS